MSRGEGSLDAMVQITPEHGLEQGLRSRLALTLTLLRSWVRRELQIRYRQSALKAAWSLIQPVTILATYGFVLTQVLDVQKEQVPYLTFAWAGIVPFTFFQQSLGLGVGSIQQSGALISRVYFPREVLPLSIVGAALADLAIMTVVMIGLTWVQVGPPTIHILGLVVVFAVLLVWTAGLTMIAAALTVFRRDLNHAMPLILRVLFIASPVMYSASLLGSHPGVNPIAAIIEGTRDVTFRATWPDPMLMLVHGVLGIGVLVAGFVTLRRLEPRMGDFV